MLIPSEIPSAQTRPQSPLNKIPAPRYAARLSTMGKSSGRAMRAALDS
jgi:hypothetical protein